MSAVFPPKFDFNPRSHTGSDLLHLKVTHLQGFQSTLPHGERRTAYGIDVIHQDFNPRSHTGSDLRTAH